MTAEQRAAFLAAALLAGAFGGAGRANAVVPRHPAPRATTSPASVLQAALKRAREGDCKGVLSLLDPLVALPAQPGDKVRDNAQLLRMPCLAAEGRGKEVSAVLAELDRTVPDNPLVRAYHVFVDTDQGRYAEAADRLGALADARSPALKFMPGLLWRSLSQKLTAAHDEARRERVALALAEAEWDPADEPELAQGLASGAVGALLDRHATADARRMLARVTSPGLLWEMAIERRYQPLWPEIEKRMGPESGASIDAFARSALAAYADDPKDAHHVREAAYAFLLLGHPQDVASTTDGIAIQPGMGDDQVSAVLFHAQSLAAAGDRQGSLALLRKLAALDFRRSPQAAVSLIALAEQLHNAGLYEEELKIARQGLARPAADALSAYGEGWLKRNEVCALTGLKRADEAKAAGDRLKAAAADNQAAAVEGLLCAGRDDEAAAIAIAALGTREGVDRLADQFQPGEAVYAHIPSPLRVLWARLLARKDVRAAFDRVARILPKPLWPSKGPRPVPVVGVADPSSVT